MPRKTSTYTLAILAILILLVVTGCDREQGSGGADSLQGPLGAPNSNQDTGPQGPAGDKGDQGPLGDPGETYAGKLNVMAVLTISSTGYADLIASIYDAPTIPRVTLNDENVMPDYSWMFDGGRLAFDHTIRSEGLDSVRLDIEYTKKDSTTGTATSAIGVPVSPTVVTDTVNILWGENAQVVWHKSDTADAYWVAFSSVLSYKSAAGTTKLNYLSIDTVLAPNDTTFLVPTSEIFPDSSDVQSIYYFISSLSLRTVTGPWFPGETNNFNGDAFGIFVGLTDPQAIDINLVDSLPAPAPSYHPDNYEVDIDAMIDTDELLERRLLEISGRLIL